MSLLFPSDGFLTESLIDVQVSCWVAHGGGKE